MGNVLNRPIILGLGLVGLALLLATVGTQVAQRAHALQERVLVGIDADPAGNTAASLDTIDTCVSVESGQTFDVDVFIKNVNDLAGWQATVDYNSSVLRVVGYDVRLFAASDPNSNLLDISESAPSETGVFTMAAADFALAPGESGDGVLGRLTMEAVGAGYSDLQLSGIVLADSQTGTIEDFNFDSIYDGATSGGMVSVDAPCSAVTPSPSPEPSPATTGVATPAVTASPTPTTETPTAERTSTPTPTQGQTDVPPPTTGSSAMTQDEGDGFPWAVVGGIVGGVAAIALLGLVITWRLRAT